MTSKDFIRVRGLQRFWMHNITIPDLERKG